MHHIIVSDVFGKTKALEEIASALSGRVEIVDPYSAELMGFKNETAAYEYFTSEVGLDAYAERLLEITQSVNSQIYLIGFSVGASAIWKISKQVKLKNISGATCFYGSQIRHHKDINPLFPVQLIFPATEQHFSVTKLIDELFAKENTQIQQVTFLHGFMNAQSKNYDQAGYKQFIQALCHLRERSGNFYGAPDLGLM